MLSKNLVRHHDASILFFESFLKFPNTINYEWVGVTEVDGKAVDIVEARVQNSRNFGGLYRIFITQEDHAIIRFDLFGADQQVDFGRPWHADSVDVSYTFRNVNGKYYMNYGRIKYIISNIDVKVHRIVRREYYSREIMITNVITNDVDHYRKTHGPAIGAKSLALQSKNYNANFWNSYNVLKENPVDQEIIQLFEDNSERKDESKGRNKGK